MIIKAEKKTAPDCAKKIAHAGADCTKDFPTVYGSAVRKKSRIHRFRIRSSDSQLNDCHKLTGKRTKEPK